jgi:hypothetical protein
VNWLLPRLSSLAQGRACMGVCSRDKIGVLHTTAFARAGPEDRNMKKELKDAANAVEEASNSTALVIAARAGFAVSGVLHVLTGSVAIEVASG